MSLSGVSRVQQKLNIGLFGAGTVGGGVYDLINKAKEQLNSLDVHCEISKICVRDMKKSRTFNISSNTKIVTNYDDILKDPSINCIVELIGGITDAKKIVFDAIRSGKHVVTGNKALIAHHLSEINQLLKENPTVKFGYEAAVCGGIPIIHSLQSDYSCDQITEVAGIINGCTNYMLSRMAKEGLKYEDILKEAKELSFAEADPSTDVDGFDAQHKIVILTKLVFGYTILPSQVPTKGISSITDIDMEYAKMMDCTIKLLGVSKRLCDTKISVYVSPVMVSNTNVIASVHGSTNLVNVLSRNLGSTAYVGPGAGRYPTANSVVNDLSRISCGLISSPFPKDLNDLQVESDFSARFYVRIRIRDQMGIIRVVGELAEASGVSIFSILQAPILDPMNMFFVVTTGNQNLSQVKKMCQAITKQPFALEEPLYMPIMS